MSVLNGLLYHCLLHGSEHAGRVLLHVHSCSRCSSCWVALIIHEHLLLLLGHLLLLLIILALAAILVVSLLLVTTWFSVDNLGLLKQLRITHLTWNSDLLNQALVHGWSRLLRIIGHRYLLGSHELLLLMMLSLVLVHALTTMATVLISTTLTLVHLLT